MAAISIQRLSQSRNQYNSYSYRVINGTPEDGTRLYGDNNDILYSSQKIGVWNKPVEVQQFLGRNKTTGKTYSGFSIDKELNSFSQRGHTATLAVKAGLDAEKISMLKMISELDEQEMKVKVLETKMKALNPAVNPMVQSASKNNDDIEEAEIVDESKEEPKEETVEEELIN